MIAAALAAAVGLNAPTLAPRIEATTIATHNGEQHLKLFSGLARIASPKF
jgi:hypothetical protein